MSTSSTATPSVSTLVPAPTASLALEGPRPLPGRLSGLSDETVGRLGEVIQWQGVSDVAAGPVLGLSRQTLGRWKFAQTEQEWWRAMAREPDTEAKLEIVDEAMTANGQPDWRAAARALLTAFPEDYKRPGKKRAVASCFSAVAGITRGEGSRGDYAI